MPKVLGKEIFDFFKNSEWGDGLYYDAPFDDDIAMIMDDDGDPTLDLKEKYDLSCFEYVCSETLPDSKVPSFAKLFKKWKNEQTCVIQVVYVPKDKVDEFTEMALALKCKIQP